MVDLLTESQGATRFPILTSDLVEGHHDDIIKTTLAAVFQSAITAALSATWATVTTGTELAGTNPVQQLHPGRISVPILQGVKFTFPLLAFARVGTVEYSEKSLAKDEIKQPWDLHWILGPLRPAEFLRLENTLVNIVPARVKSVCDAGGIDPSYTPTGLKGDGKRSNGVAFVAGDSPYGPKGINLGSVRLVSADSQEQTIGESLYYGVTFRIETTEYDTEPVENYPDFTSAGVSIAVGGGNGELIPDFIKREWEAKG